MQGAAVSNENQPGKNPKDAAIGLLILIATFGTLLWVMNRGQTYIRTAEQRCDRLYRAALKNRTDLNAVKNCYVEVFRLKPWSREAAFKVQSVGDLERERTHPLQSTPLSEIAHGNLDACNRIESDPLLTQKDIVRQWLTLCLTLTR